MVAGQSYAFQVTATDQEGDRITFAVSNLPSWARFDTATGRLSGTPSADDVGVYTGVAISASDGKSTSSLAPFSITVSAIGTGSAALSWTPPSQNTDGSALTNLVSYEIRYGRDQNDLSETITITNPSVSSYVVENLGSGAWFFAVVAVNSSGASSALSNVASKTI